MPKENLREEVVRLTKKVPDHHGFKHDEEVSVWSSVLASFEGVEIEAAVSASLLHDLRKKDDEELSVRRIKVGWNVPGEINIKEIYRKHKNEIIAGETDFWEAFKGHRDVLTALRVIAVSKDERKADESDVSQNVRDLRAGRLMTQIVGDGDKLSRAGIPGLISILEANLDYGVPFYNEGDKITRSKGAPIIRFDEITSCIKDINSCTGDWEKMMDTEEGKKLMPILDKTSYKFLKIFKQHKDILDYDVWLGWLRSVVDSQKEERTEAKVLFEEGKYKEFLSKTIELENPDLLNEESFQKYLSSRQK